MTKKVIKKVTPQDLKQDLAAIIQAAGKGELCIIRDAKWIKLLSSIDLAELEIACQKLQRKQPPTPSQVAERARMYVSRIDSLATPAWRGKVSSLWQRILSDPAFLSYLTPTPKARKERLCNLYALLGIVGVMRSHGIYDECLRDVQLANAVTLSHGDDSYRSFIGRGIEDRELKKRLVEWIRECG